MKKALIREIRESGVPLDPLDVAAVPEEDLLRAREALVMDMFSNGRVVVDTASLTTPQVTCILDGLRR